MTPARLPLPPLPGARVPAVLARLPGAAARRLDGSVRGVTNARTALAAVRLAVTDRRALAPRDDEPGWLAELPRSEALRLLSSRSVGRLAYVPRAGVPDVVPVNYVLDGEDVLVRSGPGPKLQAAERGDVVAFEVDDLDEQSRTGWSVVVVGRARREPSTAAGVEGPQPWAAGPRRHVVRIVPTRITGRRLG